MTQDLKLHPDPPSPSALRHSGYNWIWVSRFKSKLWRVFRVRLSTVVDHENRTWISKMDCLIFWKRSKPVIIPVVIVQLGNDGKVMRDSVFELESVTVVIVKSKVLDRWKARFRGSFIFWKESFSFQGDKYLKRLLCVLFILIYDFFLLERYIFLILFCLLQDLRGSRGMMRGLKG